jgi:methyl-accepting chemotaxis protein
MSMDAIFSFLRVRPVIGLVTSAVALLLTLLWPSAWLAPVLIVLLAGAWIIELRRATPIEEPVIEASLAHHAPVREALEEVRSSLVDELGHATRELHQALDLLRDAVSELGGGFDGLSRKTGMQQSLLRQIIDAQNEGVSVQDFAARTGDLLEHFVGMVVQMSRESLRIVYRIDGMAKEMDAVFGRNQPAGTQRGDRSGTRGRIRSRLCSGGRRDP